MEALQEARPLDRILRYTSAWWRNNVAVFTMLVISVVNQVVFSELILAYLQD